MSTGLDVTIGGRELRVLIDAVSEVVERSRSTKASGRVRIAALGDSFTVAAFDGEVALTAASSAKVQAAGVAWVAANALRRTTQAQLEASLHLRNNRRASQLLVEGSKGTRRVTTSSDDSVEPLPVWEGVLSAALQLDAVRAGAWAVAHCASTDPNRAGLHGVFFEVGEQGQSARIAATDGHRLSWRGVQVDGHLAPLSGLLPTPVLSDLASLSGQVADVGVTTGVFAARVENLLVTARLREGVSSAA